MNPEDFRRVMARRAQSRSAHFALHHLAEPPLPRCQPASHRLSTELSTDLDPDPARTVDDSSGSPSPTGRWIGLVVPKRHARRAVTRNLIKRQMRAAAARHAGRWPQGMLVLRLASGFDRARYPSAASSALRELVRAELGQLMLRGGAAHVA